MDDPRVEALTQRLDRLERENGRLKRIGGVVLVGLAAVVLMGQAMPGKVAKVVEAERFVLRDSAGKVRVILGSEPMGWGDPVYGLHLYGSEGEMRARLVQLPYDSGGFLTLGDKDTASSANLSVEPGSVALTMEATQRTKNDAKLEAGFLRKATAGSTPEERQKASETLTAWPREGYVASIQVLSMPTQKVQRATLEIGHQVSPVKNDNVVRLGSWQSGPSLTLSDDKGSDRAVLGHTELEATRTGVVEQRPVSSLVLFDKDGKVIWRAP